MTQTTSPLDFSTLFRSLTGNSPLRWQERLFREHIVKNKIPAVIDLPTGLGKTMVMAIWLIARSHNPDLPTRLIYIVDRRTVVDQATDLAEKLVSNWKKKQVLSGNPPAISTLRGQLADNREWSRDPSRPAIVIGTVDLIGSALLFSGYRSSYKRRPLEAGLLGQDSLLILDEAHLSKPFEKLIRAISDEGPYQKCHDCQVQGNPMRVICMSATSGNSTDSKPPFTLLFDADGNLTGEDAADATIDKRFGASKTLKIAESDKLVDTIATEADKLAMEKPGSRIVIFVRTPKLVTDVRKVLEKQNKEYGTRIAQLTGTMRGLERDELVDTEKPLRENDHKRRVMQRFLVPENDPSQGVCFLISTSAGEVGFDLNADHLVGDAAPLDSWIQRLGRVNRRGVGDATVYLIKEKEPAEKTDFDLACIETSKLLTDCMDVSPKALAAFKESLTPKQIEDASSPKPTTVELTDILLDGWSMTSITDRMPGRPEVGPWLRGIDDGQAQTTVAWRAELEPFSDTAPERALRAIFIKHPIRPHESLTVNTGHLLDEFLKRIAKLKDRPSGLMSTRVAVRLPRGQVVCRTLQQLVDDPGILYADSTLILPAKFGGLDNSGMLDVESVPKARKDDDPESQSLDVADHPGYEQREDALPRLRVLIQRTDDGMWKPQSLSGGVVVSERLQLEEDYATSTLLFVDLRKYGLRIRRVQPIEFNEEGDAVRSLIMLSPVSNKDKLDDQPLDEHVSAVETEAKRIADALHLAEDDPIRIALLFAARWHDEGKKAAIWQRFVYGPDVNGYKGKSSQTRDPKSLSGYRHEFGSLLRIGHPQRENTTGCDLPHNPGVRELALHLIATHHGGGRPHFGPGQYHPFNMAEVDAVHTDVIRRFARLQRKHGWWHLAWLENLLRCADALASVDQDAEDDPVDAEGDAV